MESIKYENKTYVSGDYVLVNAPVYSKGCRSSRDLIKKKNIESNKYLFARLKNNDWVITDGKSPKFDKVFILKSFVKTIPELNDETAKITDDKGIEKAPDIIHLEDNQKFKDTEGNIIEIETRGERNVNKAYFKVKDVAVGFSMDKLQDTILHKDTKYFENKHYKYFICDNPYNIGKNTDKKTDYKTSTKKELFLTYQGMLRVLFVTENNKTDGFIKWATETLFTIQLGTTEEKDKLISQIKGVSYESIQELFSANARSLPCVYLTAFNTVDKLREVMAIDNTIPDDSVVYKFGLTKSFETRKNGHKSEYKKLDKLIDMKLVCYTYIDPLYISEAETEIKNLLVDYKIKWEEHDELVVIPNNMMKIIKTIYENIGMKYSGHTHEFNKQINELNNQINQLKNNENNYVKDIENLNLLHQKDIQIYKQIIISKDLEIDNLKKENKILTLEMQLSKIK
jgi:hypothetical protein